MAAVLVDAGALVAFIDAGDNLHGQCVAALEDLADPLITVWPAVTEAMHLLSRSPRGQEALFDMIDDVALGIASLDESDLRRMKVLMRKYRDQPMDFADAALVRVAERDKLTRILTFDRHFEVYSLPDRARFVILPA